MAGEWKKTTLGELTVNHDAKRKPIKEADRRPGPYPYYGASGIVDHVDDYLFDGDYLLIAEDGENLRTRQTPIAFMARGKFWVNNHAHVVAANEKADTRFLMYAIEGMDISGHLTGAVMPKLTQGNLNKIELNCPPLPEQRAIAHILGTLDDKIELNRKQNETLEAMARALFKAWFVDFEPVRAKMEGRWQRGQSLPGLPAHLYDLFPDRLVESELGEIPEGWETKRVSDYLSLAYGKSLPAGKRQKGIYPVYGSGGLVGFHNEAMINGPTVIVGRKGTVGSLYWEDRPCFPIDTVFYVQPKVPLSFCYYLLESLPLRDMNTDAAVPGLNRENVYRLEVAAPPRELVSHFAETTSRFRESIAAISKSTEALSQLRDTLLPKLISGELRVPNAERIVGGLAQ
jgi:type I restriction enzyme S subunit